MPERKHAGAPDAVLARPLSLASYPVATGRPRPGQQRPRARVRPRNKVNAGARKSVNLNPGGPSRSSSIAPAETILRRASFFGTHAPRDQENQPEKCRRESTPEPPMLLWRDPLSLASYPVATGRPRPGHQRPRAREGEEKGLTRQTRSRSASSRASTTRSASSSAAPTVYATRNICGSRCSHACSQRSEVAKNAHTTSRRPDKEMPGKVMNEPIPFNWPYVTGKELAYVAEAQRNHQLSGDGPFTKRCHKWIEQQTGCARALLTHSCTSALDLAALLRDIKSGDEV